MDEINWQEIALTAGIVVLTVAAIAALPRVMEKARTLTTPKE